MGYFSALAAEQELVDNSYPTPEKRLLNRIEDLETRADELSERRRFSSSFRRLSEEELEYADPWSLNGQETAKALELARLRIGLMSADEGADAETEGMNIEVIGQLRMRLLSWYDNRQTA